MKVILEDFDYKGHHFNRIELNLRNVKELNDADAKKIAYLIMEDLKEL